MADVSIYTDKKGIVIVYAGHKNVLLELETEQERELVEKLMDDVNLWHNFLSSLSAALTQQLGGKNG